MPSASRHRDIARQRPWRRTALLLLLVPALLFDGKLSGVGSPREPLEAMSTRLSPLAETQNPAAPQQHKALVPRHASAAPQYPAHRAGHIMLSAATRATPRTQATQRTQAIPPTKAPPSTVAASAGAHGAADGAANQAPVANAATSTPPTPAAPPTPVWLDVELNGQHPGIALLQRDADGHLWARGEDLGAWRLPVPKTAPLVDQGEAYFPLSDLPGLEYRIDEVAQQLLITAQPKLFSETGINDRVAYAAMPDRARPGAFLNYDVVATHLSGEMDTKPMTLNGFFEVGAFNRWGEATTTAVRSGLSNDPSLIRLDTTFTRDRPELLASLRVGDSISGISSWSGAVHFGGVQWSTDFSTQPGFVTTPLAGIRGEAVLPSTLDLYINNAMRLQTTIPPGPFAINDLPVNSGEGEARVVVRNMLGQEQTISVPYYVSPSLLRQGLSSYSFEIGAAR